MIFSQGGGVSTPYQHPVAMYGVGVWWCGGCGCVGGWCGSVGCGGMGGCGAGGVGGCGGV
jgi:hypothetical protein